MPTCRSLLLALAIVTGSLVLRAYPQRTLERAKMIPRFEDYPVTEVWRGIPAPVKLGTPAEHMFRTELKTAAKEPPNFAGHYRVTQWGCGTRCAAGALIDLTTGDVFSLPRSLNRSGWEHWIFCASMYDKGGIDSRPDSRILVVRCGAQADDQGNNTPDSYYFLWEQNHFRLLVQIAGGGKSALG